VAGACENAGGSARYRRVDHLAVEHHGAAAISVAVPKRRHDLLRTFDLGRGWRERSLDGGHVAGVDRPLPVEAKLPRALHGDAEGLVRCDPEVGAIDRVDPCGTGRLEHPILGWQPAVQLLAGRFAPAERGGQIRVAEHKCPKAWRAPSYLACTLDATRRLEQRLHGQRLASAGGELHSVQESIHERDVSRRLHFGDHNAAKGSAWGLGGGSEILMAPGRARGVDPDCDHAIPPRRPLQRRDRARTCLVLAVGRNGVFEVDDQLVGGEPGTLGEGAGVCRHDERGSRGAGGEHGSSHGLGGPAPGKVSIAQERFPCHTTAELAQRQAPVPGQRHAQFSMKPPLATAARSRETASPRRRGIREVAERAGVAISSVSRVLSDHPDVSAEMRDRVMGAVAEVGYRPDMLAQSLRLQKTMSVGFLASHISNPVLAETVTGAERALRSAGYSMLVTDAEGDAALDVGHIALLAQRRVDGLLLSLSDERDPAIRVALSELEMPFVLVDRDVPEGLEAPQVRFDHRQGMQQAAERLWSLGHRRVAVVVGGPRRPARERQAGVEDVFSMRGGELLVLSGPFTIDHGSRAVAAALAAEPRVTAIIAAGNLYMRGALRALRERGVVPGRDISFVGCDDVAVAEFHEPPIAVVRRDPRRIGDVAARLLLATLGAGQQPPADDLQLPTEFVERPSLAPA
jgi:LacI family transcriptional regulator